MVQVLFHNARVFDGFNSDCPEGMSVLVEDGMIRDVSDKPISAPNAQRIDVAGKTLMPGLIDLHVHAYFADVNVAVVENNGSAFRTAHAVRMVGHPLDWGFPTVRDIGGGDWSLSRALRAGLIRGPRFFYAGKILSMTGGHGDMRPVHISTHDHSFCSCGNVNTFAVIADGIDECLKATREELRRGAHCIKIMGSGGVASPLDPIWMNQYSEPEIRAIVGECAERRSYVSSHCHPASGVRRSVEFGVRVIEHGTLIDADTAAFVADRDAFVVPTMAVAFALTELGAKLGLPKDSQEKLAVAFEGALRGLDHMRSAGVKLGFGTDLLGLTYDQQCREFTIRSEVFAPIEILRQATSIAAQILMHEGRLGCVAADAFADLIVVNGDPLADISLLAADGRNLDLIMRDGEIIKNTL